VTGGGPGVAEAGQRADAEHGVHRVAVAVGCFFQEPVLAELLRGDGQVPEEGVQPCAGDGPAISWVVTSRSEACRAETSLRNAAM
jgi:hypothetical protein